MVIAATLWVTGCATLPPLEGRPETHVVAHTADTRLGRSITPRAAEHPGQSGIYALAVPTDAFAARVVLAATAEKTLDVQYYIWRGDQTGYLLFEALWRAAGRGVRVRLLLDDNNTKGLDETIAALDAHPNIEVRLYNPVASRSGRMLQMLGDFSRLNRRMHNKSFTADDQATIVGGRNVGNEYFGAGEETLFTDLDVLAIGKAVHEVSAAFDLYWNSASAYPASLLLEPAGDGASGRLLERFAQTRDDPESKSYIDAVRDTPLVQELLDGKLAMEWADARAVRDDPAKTLDPQAGGDTLMLTGLLATFGNAANTFDLVSPYFVPGKDGAAALVALASRGVATRVLTNSLAATDVGAVHAGYSKSREELLRGGVRLYELKPTATTQQTKKKGQGSSPESLHAKTFAVDRKRIFVGSFNFDPRSARLNTEMGLVIESPALASRLAATLDQGLAQNAYELRLSPGGSIEWIERVGTSEIVHEDEPRTGALRRAWIRFLSWLPIDWLL